MDIYSLSPRISLKKKFQSKFQRWLEIYAADAEGVLNFASLMLLLL